MLQLVARAYPARHAHDDAHVITRAVGRTKSRQQPRALGGRTLRWSWALILVGVLSGGALAAVAFRSQWQRPASPQPVPPPPARLPALAPPSPPLPPPEPPPRPIATMKPRALAATPAPSTDAAAENGAGQLFEEARRARAMGWDPLAAQKFEELLSRFPDSPEADVSRLAAGRLYRRLGNHTAALAAFSSYLRHNPGGALEEEAMAGTAQSLESLGQDAAAAWQALAAAHPQSPYLKERASKP